MAKNSVAALLLLFGLSLLEARLTAQAGHELQAAAMELSHKLDLLLFERYGDIQVMARIFNDTARDRRRWAEQMAVFQRVYPLYRWIGVIDKNGRVLAATDPATVGYDVGRTDWFKDLAAKPTVLVHDSLRDELTDGETVVQFSAPIWTPTQADQTSAPVDAVVVTRIALSRLEGIVTHTLQGLEWKEGYEEGLEYKILSRQGLVLSESLVAQHDTADWAALKLESARLVFSGPSGFIEEQHQRRHLPVLTGYARIPARKEKELDALGWGILVQVDREVVLSPIRSMIWKVALGGGLLLILMVGMLLWATSQLRMECERAELGEQKLQEEITFTQSTLDALNAHIAVLDERATIVTVNESWRRFAEVNQLQAPRHGLGLNYLNICLAASEAGAEGAQWVTEGIEAALRGEQTQSVVEYPCHAPQTQRWFAVRITTFDVHGRRRVVVAHEDVTDVKLADQAVRLSEARFATILDVAEEAIVSIDEAHIITLFNQGASKVFGYAPAEVLGQPLNILLPERFAQGHDRHGRAFGASPTGSRPMGARSEVTGRRKSGEEFPGEASLAKVSVEGRVTYTVILRDISERKHREQELKGAKDRAERVAQDKASILAVVEAFFIGVDAEGTVMEWTGQAERLFGIPLCEAVAQPFHELPIRWNWGEVLGAMRQAGDTLTVVRLNKLRTIVREETEAFLKMTVSPLHDDHGMSYVIMGENVTSRLVLEHELVQAQKLESIGQLAAGIAHEINTPIQFVGDNIRFLSDSFAGIHATLARYREVLATAKSGHWPPGLIATCETEIQQVDLDYLIDEIPKALAQSSEGIDRVAKIVRAMKEFAHPGSEEKALVDLNRAIESTVTVARNEWKYVADLRTDLDPALPPVPCLAGELNQVVLNMIINATHAIVDVVKGTGAKGTITITTRRAGDFAEIRIEDTGAGIPEAIRHKIFEPFFTTKEIGRGTGQGLAIARSVVVNKHRGTITVESQVGKGTTFLIRLPLHVPTDDKAVEQAA